jgi:WD40 repeat protein
MEHTINQGADVKTVAWHPQKGLLVCGDKNFVITLLDPRTGSKLRTIYDHKGEVSVCKWNKNGNWFLSASRDQSIKLWDLRNLADPIRTFQGQGAAVTSLAWHPVHEDMWVSGGMDGSLAYWLADKDKPQANFKGHDAAVWAVDWHPVGHLLVTGSQDKSARFWTRNRPGDTLDDRYNSEEAAEAHRQERNSRFGRGPVEGGSRFDITAGPGASSSQPGTSTNATPLGGGAGSSYASAAPGLSRPPGAGSAVPMPMA